MSKKPVSLNLPPTHFPCCTQQEAVRTLGPTFVRAAIAIEPFDPSQCLRTCRLPFLPTPLRAVPARVQLPMPNLRPAALDLLTFCLPYPGSCSFSEEKVEAAGKDPGAPTHSLTDLRDPTSSKTRSLSVQSLCSHLWGSCHLMWPWQASGTEAQADHESQLPLPSPCQSGLGAAALLSCLTGTEDLCWPLWVFRLGQGLGGKSVYSTAPPPWHKAEHSLRLINLLPSLLFRHIFYSWTSGVLCFTRTWASIFHTCLACQLPAPSFLFPPSSRTWNPGHAGLVQDVITDGHAAFFSSSACGLYACATVGRAGPEPEDFLTK